MPGGEGRTGIGFMTGKGCCGLCQGGNDNAWTWGKGRRELCQAGGKGASWERACQAGDGQQLGRGPCQSGQLILGGGGSS